MAIDRWWLLLSQLTLAVSIALLAIAVIRVLARRWLFPRATYALWLLLPLSVLAVSLPATRKVVVIDTSPTAQTTIVGEATPVLPEASSRPMLLLLWASGCAISWIGFALLQRHFVRRLGAQRGAGRIWRSPRTDVSPVVIGLWRPRIVLPADFELRFDPDEQRLITDHETAHLQRLDVPANALAALIVGVFWFHPLVWLAWRQFRIDQEFACDADVLEQHPTSRKTYAAAMLKAQLNLDALPLGCHWSRTHPLTRRIEMLKQPTPSRVRIHAVRILLALLALSLSYALWAQKPAVTTLVSANASQAETALNATVFTTIGTSRKLHDPIVDLRAPISLVHSFDGVDWTFELNVVPDESHPNSARVSTVIKRDGVVMGSPIIVVGYGEPGVVRISDDGGAAIYEMEIRVGASDAPAVSMEIKFGPEDRSVERVEDGVRIIYATVERNAEGIATALVIPKNGLDENDPQLMVQLMQQSLAFQRFEEDGVIKAERYGVRIREHGDSSAPAATGFSFGDRELIDFGVTNFRRSPTTGQLALGVKQLAVRDAFLAAASLANLRVTNPNLSSTTQTLDFELSDVPANTLLDTIARASKPPFAYVIDGDAITLSR